MKKVFYYVFAGLLTFGMMTSCDDDEPNNGNNTEQPGSGDDNGDDNGGESDDNDYTDVIDNQFAGNYKGTLTVKVDGANLGGTSQKISVSKADKNAINLLISNFSFAGIPLGDIKLEKCVLEKQEGDVYTCSREDELTLAAPVGACTVKSETSIKAGSVSINLDIDVPVLGQKVQAVYEGTKMSGQESKEAKITKFIFDTTKENNAIVISQPVLDEASNTYTFAVNEEKATPEALKALEATIEVSDKASYEVKGDFSADATITVTAEDLTVVTYTVKAPVKNSIMAFSFDEWVEEHDANNPDRIKWFTPAPNNQLATANNGVGYLMALDFMGQYNLSYGTTEDKGYKGSAAKLITQYTKGAGFNMAPAITPGSLFTGKFEFQAVMDQNEQLKLTKFGIPYEKKPVSFKGVYKYKEGTKFIDGSDKSNVKEDTGEKDECGIYALLYEATDENGKEVILDGTTIPNSPYRVAIAELTDGVDSNDKWIEFNIPFKELKDYDKNKTYKLAIVCSSSKEGDKFRGAVNSTLWVDELEVIGE